MENDNVIRALLGEKVTRTPIWLMRQAGRYLPEYRELRKTAGSFMAMCQNPELACQITLQPIQRFDLDAAIIFSDILTIPDAMGLGLYFVENEGPKFHHPILDQKMIKQLELPDVEEKLNYVAKAIKLVSHELRNKLPLFGFAGSPWTVATYMIENGSSKTFHKIKSLMYQSPTVLHELLVKLAEVTANYLTMQIRAGANCIMIFDTWGGILNQASYQEFSLQYMNQILQTIPRELNGQRIPCVFFSKNCGAYLELIADTGVDAISLDWTIDMAAAVKRVGQKVALQGNLDPAVLLANNDVIKLETQKVLKGAEGGKGHVFNLGHGITPEINPDHVEYLISMVHGEIK